MLPPSETLSTPDATLAAQLGVADLERNSKSLPPQADTDILPVIGIGGSAGAIRPLQQFFEGMAPDSGLAFVVVLHLAPDAESALAQIIQARTAMRVVQVLEPTLVEPNHVYVIAPGKHLAMRDGFVLPCEPDQPRGKRVAVDLFFRTLAASQRSRAVAIVLSGLDSDGSIGVKRIKEEGGLAIVQDPQQAEHDGMPRSALETGMVDWVLPIEAMPGKLLEFMRNEMSLRFPAPEQPELRQDIDEIALRDIMVTLHARTGHDFSHYKRPTILRRIGRRLQVHSLPDFPQYAALLRTQAGEADALLQDLLISVTNFFRDKEAFMALEAEIPRLFRHKGPADTIRVWVPGCATGEEAYSLAMLLLEHAQGLPSPPQIQIFATDIDENATRTARAGIYPAAIAADLSPDRLTRFFHFEQGRYRARKEIREMILFASHNLLKDSPFSRLDLVSCRNLLIYFDTSAQERALGLFHFALRPEALLFLGLSEAAADEADLFAPLSKKSRLFIRKGSTRPGLTSLPLPPRPHTPSLTPATPQFPTLPTIVPFVPGVPQIPATPAPARERGSSLGELHLLLLEQYAPPSVLVNEAYEVVHLSPGASRYLSLAPGEISISLLAMVHPALRLELRTALFRAAQTAKPADTRALTVEIAGQARTLDIRVRPMRDPSLPPNAAPRFFLVIFDERIGQALADGQANVVADGVANSVADGTPQVLADGVEGGEGPVSPRIEEELSHLKSYLRETIEQYEISGEELRSNNEELQAMNEEMRSTGEELETSKEEIQAANEELSTLNQELRSKVEEVSRANADLHNLMASTEIATVFLDRQGLIQRYTPRALDLFQIIPTDRGHPLSDLRHQLRDANFARDAEQVLATLRPSEREVSTVDGRDFALRVLPYRTLEDKIDGVVLTFLDITERKRTEQALRRSEAEFRTISNAAPALVWVMEPGGENIFFNERWFEFTGQSREEAGGSGWRRAAHPDDWPRIESLWNECNASGQPFEGELRLRRADSKYLWHAFRALPRRDSGERIEAWYGCSIDIDQAKQAESALSESQERLSRALEIETVGVIFYRADGAITYANHAFRRLCGYSGGEQAEAEELRWDTMTPPEWMPQSHHAIGELLKQGRTAPYEKQYTRRDGSRWWALCSATRLSESEGVEFTIDISEHKQAQSELLQLRQSLRRESERADEVLEGLGEMFYALDSEFRFTYVNARAAQAWGRQSEELLGRHYWNEFPQAVGSEPYHAHLRAMRERQPIEVDMMSAILGRQVAGSIRPGADGGLLVYFRDIHEQYETQAARHEAEEKLSIAVEAGELGTWDWDLRQDDVQWNEMHFALFGLQPRPNPVSPQLFSDHLHPEDRERVLQSLQAAVESSGVFQNQFRIVRESDGAVRWMSGYGRVVESQNGRATRMIGVVFDSTERQEADEVLRRSHDELEQSVRERTGELARVNEALEGEVAERKRAEAGREMLLRRLVSAQEEERRRISRELHDQMGQTLTALMMGLKSLPDIPDTGLTPPSPNETIAKLQNITTELMDEVHNLAWDLRPAVLDNLGLEAALGQYVSEWSRRSGTRADFLSHGMSGERLPEHVESALYRTVQEALTNVARHSHASHVSVLLERVEGEAVAIVEDDGAGFDMEAVGESASGRLGLAGMRERVEIAGGTLTIESSMGAGTTVYARVPVER